MNRNQLKRARQNDNLFKEIVQNIKEDISEEEKRIKEEGSEELECPLLEILEEDASHIRIRDDMEECMYLEYAIMNPNAMDLEWLKKRIIVTPSVSKLPFSFDVQELAEFIIKTLDKAMYLNLNRIVFLNDLDEDYDYLVHLDDDDEFAYALEEHELPYDMLGIQWHAKEIVLVNLGEILKVTEQMVEDGDLESYEVMGCVNHGIFTTLVHEIRHLAQSNPYLPEHALNFQGEWSTASEDENAEEMDAETYCRDFCDSHSLPYVIREKVSKESKVA